MKTAWICVSTEERRRQANILQGSLSEWCPSVEFIHIYISLQKTVIHKEVALARLRGALTYLNWDYDQVIISGADYMVYGDIETTLSSTKGEALFAPHTTKLHQGVNSQNLSLIKAGVINSDFQVWRNTKEVLTFLETIIQNIKGLGDTESPFLYEQLWLPYTLATLNAHLIRNKGIGAAYYNLHEREIRGDMEAPYVFDKEQEGHCYRLLAFHYSGFSPHKTGLTTYGKPYDRKLTKCENELIAAYGQLLLEGNSPSEGDSI